MRFLIIAAALTSTISIAHAAPSCPGDTVVWLNQNTGVYHLPGDRWYGHTKSGAYVCEKQAMAKGGHLSDVREDRHQATKAHRTARRADDSDGPEGDDQPAGTKPTGEIENPF